MGDRIAWCQRCMIVREAGRVGITVRMARRSSIVEMEVYVGVREEGERHDEGWVA